MVWRVCSNPVGKAGQRPNTTPPQNETCRRGSAPTAGAVPRLGARRCAPPPPMRPPRPEPRRATARPRPSPQPPQSPRRPPAAPTPDWRPTPHPHWAGPRCRERTGRRRGRRPPHPQAPTGDSAPHRRRRRRPAPAPSAAQNAPDTSPAAAAAPAPPSGCRGRPLGESSTRWVRRLADAAAAARLCGAKRVATGLPTPA